MESSPIFCTFSRTVQFIIDNISEEGRRKITVPEFGYKGALNKF